MADIVSVKLKPANSLKVPVDSLSKKVFVSGKISERRAIMEDKQLSIETQYKLDLAGQTLNEFDWLIHCLTCTEFSAGNEIFTVRRLFKKLGGSHYLTDEMRKAVEDSIRKLSKIRVIIDMTPINEKRHYSKKSKLIIENYLLPCKSLTVKVNGQVEETTFKLLDKPPLLDVANMKFQLASYDIALLNVPKLKNTVNVCKIKSFLMRRIVEVVGSHQPHKKHFAGFTKDKKPIFKQATKLQKKILFEKLFKQCDLADATIRQQQQAREIIEKILEHFKAQKLITEWNFEKDKNGKYRAICFNFSKKTQLQTELLQEKS